MIKQNKIYQVIRQEILRGVWKPGEKLPTETEYAQKFHIARNTLRAGLKKLEDEGYIERYKSKGTFVRLPRVSQEEKNISLLVPCCEYFRYCGIHFTKILFELIAEAAVAGWRVTPVIFSRTNDPNDIWWENLAHINQDSRIVVDRLWYAPYFEKLAGIGSSVAFINNDTTREDKTLPYTSQWMNFIEEDKAAAEKAFRYLRACGCRRIALAMTSFNGPDNCVLQKYRKLLEESGLPECSIPLTRDQDNGKVVREVFRKKHFDGLIVHCDERDMPGRCGFRSWLGLPEDFPVVAIPFMFECIYPPENIPVIEYRINALAHDIVEKLTGGQRIPCRLTYEPKLTLHGREIDGI